MGRCLSTYTHLKVKMVKQLQVTSAILKPDLYMREKAREAVKKMILEKKFFIVRRAVMTLTPPKAQEFYMEHKGRFYFQRLVDFMCIGPVESMVLAHPDAIQQWRALMGPTKPYIAQTTAPNTIRGSYGLTDTRNSTHGSDSEESAKREIGVLFPRFDLSDWYQNEEACFRSGEVTFCAQEQIHKLLGRNR